MLGLPRRLENRLQQTWETLREFFAAQRNQDTPALPLAVAVAAFGMATLLMVVVFCRPTLWQLNAS